MVTAPRPGSVAHEPKLERDEEDTMISRLLKTASAATLALVLGCASASIQTYAKPSTGPRQYAKVKKVIVMPFDSVVEGAQSSRVAGDMFLQELQARGTFEVVEERRYVKDLMQKLKMSNTDRLGREEVRKLCEELQAQALIVGDLLLFGEEKVSESVEFALQVSVLDGESGEVLWSGRSYAKSNTTVGEILGVSQGPSANDVARGSVMQIVGRLNREWRRARETEVEKMLEAAKAQEAGKAKAGAKAPPEAGAEKKAAEPVPEQKAEEILLQVKPK